MINPLLLVILLPIAIGILGYFLSRLRSELNFLGGLLTLYYAFRLFLLQKGRVLEYKLATIYNIDFKLQLDGLSSFILLFGALFGFLLILYSLRYIKRLEVQRLRAYYLYILLTIAGANGIFLSNNLYLLLVFWGFLLSILYGFFLIGKNDTSYAWQKTLTIIGLSDFLLLLGITFLFVRAGNVSIIPAFPLTLNDPYYIASFILISIGALAKAGAMPLHSWIPAAAQVLPATTMAFIPASLDKLLGIYLLTRISVYIFDLRTNMMLREFLLIIGAATVFFAVMMAIIQKEAMRLLSFHAVSQVGYMVLGIGTGIPIGVAGGVFHMLNNALYKSGLFLACGSVEYWTKDTKLDNLGGFAPKMPLTFLSFIIAAMAISGIPPLNGFVSKWMVYQGLLELGRQGNRLFVLYLLAAMLGSVLTLASFLKLTYSIFLGERPKGFEKIREVGFSMWLPTIIIALFCITFGVLAYPIALRYLIYPGLPYSTTEVGFYQPLLATFLLLLALGIGLAIYYFGRQIKKTKKSEVFVGGEVLPVGEGSFTGTNFYSSLKELPILDKLYEFGEGGAFDLFNYFTGIAQVLGTIFQVVINRIIEEFYQRLARLMRTIGQGLSLLHTGFLPLYLAWLFIGAILLFTLLVR